MAPLGTEGMAVAFLVSHLDGSSERPTVTFHIASLLDELERVTAHRHEIGPEDWVGQVVDNNFT